jgi:hypothetical protein
MPGHVPFDFSRLAHREVYPKCTYVVLLDEAGLSLPSEADYPLTYGEAYAVLTDRCKERSTWTYGDSKSRWKPGRPIQTFHHDAIRVDGGADAGKEEAKRGTILEGQVYGAVTMQDIAFFIVPGYRFGIYTPDGDVYQPRPEDELEPGQVRFLQIARLFQIPVYLGSLDTRARHTPASKRHDHEGFVGLPTRNPLALLSAGKKPEDRSQPVPRAVEGILRPLGTDPAPSSYLSIGREVYSPGLGVGGHFVEYMRFCQEGQRLLFENLDR